LRVIECVEKLGSELDMHTVVNGKLFQQRHVPIVDAWTMKEPARRISQLPNLL
jgi:hypothetical protein